MALLSEIDRAQGIRKAEQVQQQATEFITNTPARVNTIIAANTELATMLAGSNFTTADRAEQTATTQAFATNAIAMLNELITQLTPLAS